MWEAHVLISPSFIRTLVLREQHRTLSWIDTSRISRTPSSVGNLSRSSDPLDASDSISRNSGSLFRCFNIQEHSQPSMKMGSVNLSSNFSQTTFTVFGTLPCAGSCCCRHCELVFHFLPTLLIFRCRDPFFIESFNVAHLIFGSFLSEEIIDFIFPSFLSSSRSSVCFVFRAEFRVPSCCFHCPSFFW